MRSNLFYSEQYLGIQARIKDFLNRQESYISETSLNSPRAVGDALQEVLAENFAGILSGVCDTCTTDFARRAMADIVFDEMLDFYPREIAKIHKRVLRFEVIKAAWQSKTDIWQVAPVESPKNIGDGESG